MFKISKITIYILFLTLINISIGQEIKETKVGLFQYSVAAGGCGCAVGAGYLFQLAAALSGVIDMKNNPGQKYLAAFGYGLFALAPAVSAIGAYYYGNRYYAPNQRGSLGWTLAGSYIGTLPVAGLLIGKFWGGRNLSDSEVTLVIIGGIVGATLPPLGAVLGYQWSCPKSTQQGLLYNHFNSPVFCFKTQKFNKDNTVTAFDFKLINLTF